MKEGAPIPTPSSLWPTARGESVPATPADYLHLSHHGTARAIGVNKNINECFPYFGTELR